MTFDEIARKLVERGMRPVPGMLDSECDRVTSVSGGKYVFGEHEAAIEFFLSDLTDRATLLLAEDWARELWVAKGLDCLTKHDGPSPPSGLILSYYSSVTSDEVGARGQDLAHAVLAAVRKAQEG